LLLSGDCPVAVWQGADEGGAMGVYQLLHETQGVGNLRMRLDEYMPFGLEAGIFLVPSREEKAIPEPFAQYGYGARGRTRGAILEDDADVLLWSSIGATLI
jgi:hypothetical protein